MAEKALLSPVSPQFSKLEYYLQLSLKATTAKIGHAYSISNPHQAASFEETSKVSLYTLRHIWQTPLTKLLIVTFACY
jgi:hypothetical protein